MNNYIITGPGASGKTTLAKDLLSASTKTYTAKTVDELFPIVYAQKLAFAEIILLEEEALNKKETIDRIKQLTTVGRRTIQIKGIGEKKVDNPKMIITTNKTIDCAKMKNLLPHFKVIELRP